MQLREWKKYLTGLPRMDALVDRLSGPEPKSVFMIGSALSLAEGKRGRGVPGVQAMVELIRERIRREGLDEREFQRGLDRAQGDGASAYDAAFVFLRQRRGQEAVNDVIRGAVLNARKRRSRSPTDSALLEQDLDGWALSRGTRALGELLAQFPRRYPGPTLTTNFDPLLEIAVKLADGHPRRVVLDGDGRLLSEAETNPEEQQIVYLHGYWRGSDTHHTDTELTASRPELNASLARMLDRRLVVVVGYGGWEDAFMNAISSLLDDTGATPDIAWALHEDDPGELIDHHAALVDRFDQWRSRGRFNLFVGIDAHDLFERLLARAWVSAGSAAKSPAQGSPRIPRRPSRAGGPPARAPSVSGTPAHPAPSAPGHKSTAASQLRQAARECDRFIGHYAAGARAGPNGRWLLQARLTDLKTELDALTNAELAACPDKEFVFRFRKPRDKAADQIVELQGILARRGNGDTELGRLVTSVRTVRDLIHKSVPAQDEEDRSRR
jgi:hypothetical protein